jgi:hypothetical protein
MERLTMATPQELAKAVHEATAALNKVISDAYAAGLRVRIENLSFSQIGREDSHPVFSSHVYSVL